MGHTTIDQSLLRQCVTVGFVSCEDQISFYTTERVPVSSTKNI